MFVTLAEMTGWPFVLYALTGFTGLLAEQGFEKYVTLLTGATAAGAAVVIFAYFLGFAGGSAVAGALLERGAIRAPLRTYGVLELLIGVSCVLFSFGGFLERFMLRRRPGGRHARPV